MGLFVKRASASRVSAEWSDTLTTCSPKALCGWSQFRAAASLEGSPWMWTLAFGHHEDRTPTRGYVAMHEDAMAAFAKSWRLAGELNGPTSTGC
jgi:hypothetical protein